uniref:Zgc:109986 n=1 Tax=Neolamprologus brichardi TaxID=32507 RepID=A0A3Q4I1E9_NEOBR
MNVAEAKSELKRLLSRLRPAELTQLLGWMKNSDELEDELLGDNGRVLLQSIAEDLRANVPPDAMLPSETAAYSKMQRRSRPTVHVDSFLYDDEQVDSLCERGLMSRNYCLSCGSHRTAPLGGSTSPLTFVQVHMFSSSLSSCGYVYSSASRLLGLEISEAFVRLQDSMLHKYKLTDRVQVLQADVCTQDILLQNTDVVVMNNVFEYFLEPDLRPSWLHVSEACTKKCHNLVKEVCLTQCSVSGRSFTSQPSCYRSTNLSLQFTVLQK